MASSQMPVLYDRVAERLIVRGLLRAPLATVAGLRKLGFDPCDCYYWANQQAIVALIAGGKTLGPDLPLAYRQLCVARDCGRLDDFADRKSVAMYVADCWTTGPFSEWGTANVIKWGCDHDSTPAQIAAAAAECVHWHATARSAWHAAQELLRDIASPVGDAEHLTNRIRELREE